MYFTFNSVLDCVILWLYCGDSNEVKITNEIPAFIQFYPMFLTGSQDEIRQPPGDK
jgi:hypothetical protein